MTQWFFLDTMNPMLQSSMVFITLIFFGFSAIAESPQQQFNERFRSHKIEFPDEGSPLLASSPGRYPESLNFLFGTVFSWVPSGEPKILSSPCSLDLWQKRLMDPRVVGTPQVQGALIQKYFLECRNEIEDGNRGSLTNVLNMMTMKYAPQRHPFLRRVVFHLPGNVRLKGLLGLKGDLKKRPLVIVRLGIFSSIEDFKPERAWMMMLFEQSPFNILLVENMTSSDFVSNNNQIAFGGYDEGIQNILISKILQHPDEPISQIVDSVHVFGISLGGHGVLFSSLLNKYNSQKNRNLINSFTALCPVINIKPTMKALTEDGWKSAFVDLWSRYRLNGIETKLPDLTSYERFSFLSKAIQEIARSYRGGLSYISSVRLPPGMVDGSDFWAQNDFWKFYRNIEQPVIIYATQQDPAVPFKMNSQQIQNHKMNFDSKNIRVVELPKGVHCTLPAAYDWHVLTTLFQTYILSHSPEFRLTQKTFEVDLSQEGWEGFFDEKTNVKFRASEPSKKESFVKIEVLFENSKGREKSFSVSLPLSGFDFQFLNPELSGSEQEMVVRWIYQNLEMKIYVKEGRHFLRASWKVAA